MADVLVSCINKVPRNNPHEGITHLGGSGGSGWKWTKEQVIVSIEAGTNTFFTQVDGIRADIEVIEGPNSKYLRTRADGTLNDNLLSLPECP